MNVQLPDGTTLADVPEGTTKDQLIEKLHTAGNPNWLTMAKSSYDSPTRFLDHAIGDPFISVVTGTVAMPIAGLAGLVTGAMGGDAAGAVEKTQEALTYKPKSKTSENVLKTVSWPMKKLADVSEAAGDVVNKATGSPALATVTDVAIQSLPAVLGGGSGAAEEDAAATAARAAVRAKQYVEANTAVKWSDLPLRTKAMMMSIAKDAKDLGKLDPKAVERTLRAHSQPVPVPITKGQATRDTAQITREEMVRRSDAGAPLRDISAQQDEALFRNLNVLRDAAGNGSKVRSTTDVGTSVQGALRKKLAAKRKELSQLYEKAEKAGETRAPVDITPLKQWVAVPVNGREAPFIQSAINDFEQTIKGEQPRIIRPGETKPPAAAPDKNVVTINDLENIRREAVAHAMGPPSSETHYAGEAIAVIDQILDQSGGNLYRTARAARKAIGDEFERQAVIRDLSGEKGRTTDYRVAVEDTLDRAVIRGSNADLVKLKQSLGDGRAWRDLQTGAIDYLKERAGGKRRIQGEEGQGQFNSTFLDALYELDRDGKLDTLFSKPVADRVRSLAQTVHDVRTTPATRISGSDSVPRILSALESAASHVPIVGPTVIGTARLAGKAYKHGKVGRDAAEAAADPVRAAATSAAGKRRPPPRGVSPLAISSAQGVGDTGDSQ